jgi:cytochrome c oxidase subunit 4
MKHDDQRHVIGYRTLILIWLALLVLTAITVFVTRLDLGGLKVVTALVIATIKAGLVIAVFMHMKHEGWLLLSLLFLALVVVAVNIGLTFFDVIYR